MAQMDGLERLSVIEIERVIDDFAAIGTSGLGITGGEPLLCQDTLHYIRYAKAKGLLTHLSSNGMLVDDAMADAIVESGVDAVGISVDGIDAKTHDSLRGYDGSFDKALGALQKLAERKRDGKPRLIAVCVLCRENLGQIPHLPEWVVTRGADLFNLIPEHQSRLMMWGSGDHFALPRELRPKADRVLDELITLHGQAGMIDSSPAYLDMLKGCIRGEPLPVPCYAGYVTYIVDCYGQIFPCFGMVQQGRRGANVRETSLRTHWHSMEMAQSRRGLKGCRLCYWNCQTELNLLYSWKAWLRR